MGRNRRIPTVVAAGVAAGAAVVCVGMQSGCQIAGYAAAVAHEAGSTKVYAQYEGLRGHDYVVIVNMDQSLRATEPRLAAVLTNSITRQLGSPEVGATGAVPGPRVLQFMYENPSWPSWSYQRLAEEFTVSRVVVIDLYEYRLYEPGNRYIWNGRAAARVGVYEAELGSEEFAFTDDVQVPFPDETGVTTRERSKGNVESNLQARLVTRIAWLMFDHEEPNVITY
jgi:hypothetical protein